MCSYYTEFHEIFCLSCSNANYYISNATCIENCPTVGDYMEFTYANKKFCEIVCPLGLYEIDKETGRTCINECPDDYYAI